MAKSVVIITGASSGLGMEFALQLDARLRKTDEIWLIARRKDKLLELKDENTLLQCKIKEYEELLEKKTQPS